MVTGTVYLLAVTLACAAAGAASWLGLSASWQFAVCALVTVIGCALAHLLAPQEESAGRSSHES